MIEKLLVVCRHYWPENNRATELCERLADMGVKVDVLCGQPSGQDGNFIKGYNSFKVRREIHNKVNIYRSIDVRKGNGSNIGTFLNYVFFPLASMLDVKKLCLNDYDAVLIYQMSPVIMGNAGIKIASRLRIPVYMYVADLWPEAAFKSFDVQSSLLKKFLYYVTDRIYHQAEKLIVQSDAVRKKLADRLVVSDMQLPVVTLSPDESFMEEKVNVSLLEKTAGSFNCLITDGFEDMMSARVIASLAEKLRDKGIRDIRFVVIGAGDSFEELKKLIRRNDLNDYFFLEGKIKEENTGAYIHASDALLAALKTGNICENGIPVSLINLFAAGRPLLLSMNGSIREIVRSEKLGLISEADDVDALYANLIRLYNMPKTQRDEMGLNAKKYQSENYNAEINAGKILDILNGADPESDDSGYSSIRKLWDD